jgi:hypothetical protein
MKFEFVIVSAGKKLCEITRFANSISEAVKLTKEDIGHDLIVLQKKAWLSSIGAA